MRSGLRANFYRPDERERQRAREHLAGFEAFDHA